MLKRITTSIQRITPKLIRYSQASILDRFNVDTISRSVNSEFAEEVYNRSGFIMVVKYSPDHFTSYDNRRLYWARHQSLISCAVVEADAYCCENECSASLYWEAECDEGYGNVKKVHSAYLVANSNKAWVALKCAFQGPDFPLFGSYDTPKIQGREYVGRPGIFRLSTSKASAVKDYEAGSCYKELRKHIANGGHMYVRMDDGKLRYWNANLPGLFQGDDFEPHFTCVTYLKYENVALKALDTNPSNWDDEDWIAFHSEVEQIKADSLVDYTNDDDAPRRV